MDVNVVIYALCFVIVTVVLPLIEIDLFLTINVLNEIVSIYNYNFNHKL